MRSEILSFKQRPEENLYLAWVRFKSLLRDCPHHQQSNEVLDHTFVESLDPHTKILLDSASGGQALESTYDELSTLLNRIAQRNLEWHSDAFRGASKKVARIIC